MSDQIELLEGLTPEQVNITTTGAGRTSCGHGGEASTGPFIEGMFADVPCILREGHNYSYRYPCTNTDTARYADESSLPDTILEVCEDGSRFRPREWVMAHMTCQSAATVLNTHIRDVAVASGESWTTDILVKHSELGSARHWNGEDGRASK